MNKYLKEYKVSDMRAMLRNNKTDPKECTEEFNGRLVVISGTTAGIGYQTARMYASRGANLLCINRNEEKSKILCEEIKKTSMLNVTITSQIIPIYPMYIKLDKN